jgi:hypothetical protein
MFQFLYSGGLRAKQEATGVAADTVGHRADRGDHLACVGGQVTVLRQGRLREGLEGGCRVLHLGNGFLQPVDQDRDVILDHRIRAGKGGFGLAQGGVGARQCGFRAGDQRLGPGGNRVRPGRDLLDVREDRRDGLAVFRSGELAHILDQRERLFQEVGRGVGEFLHDRRFRGDERDRGGRNGFEGFGERASPFQRDEGDARDPLRRDGGNRVLPDRSRGADLDPDPHELRVLAVEADGQDLADIDAVVAHHAVLAEARDGVEDDVVLRVGPVDLDLGQPEQKAQKGRDGPQGESADQDIAGLRLHHRAPGGWAACARGPWK